MCEPAGLPHSVDLLHSGTLFSRTFPEPEACGSSDYTIEIQNWLLLFPLISEKTDGCLSLFPLQLICPLTHSQLSGFQPGLWSTISPWEHPSHCPTQCLIELIHFQHLPWAAGYITNVWNAVYNVTFSLYTRLLPFKISDLMYLSVRLFEKLHISTSTPDSIHKTFYSVGFLYKVHIYFAKYSPFCLKVKICVFALGRLHVHEPSSMILCTE